MVTAFPEERVKLRIRENSVRIRLVRDEVERLGRGEAVSQVTQFSPGAALISEIEASDRTASPAADFDEGRLVVRLPLSQASEWATSEQVGIRGEQSVGSGRVLEILVEKDFECLHPGEEKTTGAYPNPEAASPS
jgi:hypothetical protein